MGSEQPPPRTDMELANEKHSSKELVEHVEPEKREEETPQNRVAKKDGRDQSEARSDISESSVEEPKRKKQPGAQLGEKKRKREKSADEADEKKPKKKKREKSSDDEEEKEK